MRFWTRDWVDYFRKRSGFDNPMIDSPGISYFPVGGGFFTTKCMKDALFIPSAAGDGKELDEQICALAKRLGYTKVRFETRRNPRAWERKFGYKVTGYVMEKEV